MLLGVSFGLLLLMIVFLANWVYTLKGRLKHQKANNTALFVDIRDEARNHNVTKNKLRESQKELRSSKDRVKELSNKIESMEPWTEKCGHPDALEYTKFLRKHHRRGGFWMKDGKRFTDKQIVEAYGLDVGERIIFNSLCALPRMSSQIGGPHHSWWGYDEEGNKVLKYV